MGGVLRATVKKVMIENFKSIKHLELELNRGVNVLVGPNASGKTNILEAMNFLYKALVEEAGKIPYTPYSPRYWSPLDLFYLKNPEKPITIGLSIECCFNIKAGDKDEFFRTLIDFKTVFSYDSSQNTIVPTQYSISLGEEVSILISTEATRITIDKGYMDKARDIITLLRKEAIYTEFLENLQKYYILDGGNYLLEAKWKHPPPKPLLLNRLPLMSSATCGIVGDKYVCISKDYFFLLDKPLLYPYVIGDKVDTCRGLDIRGPPPTSIASVSKVIHSVVKHLLLLRHPNIGALREPRPFTGETKLDERAVNLASVLLALQGRIGGFPERIQRGFRKLFPHLSIRIDSKFGRVAIICEENGLELPPSNTPDGAIKLLAILTAIELKPSLLLIDEIENSMHARMLEYVFDELNSLDIPVVIATHSPIVVDLAGPDKTFIVFKQLEKGTVVERISSPRELSKKLNELGISFSDYIFYKKTYSED